jgi:hypothetical protein
MEARIHEAEWVHLSAIDVLSAHTSENFGRPRNLRDWRHVVYVEREARLLCCGGLSSVPV